MLDYLRIMLAARLDRDERGASAVEYGLLIAGIAALIVVVVFAFGDNITDIFNDTCKSIGDQRPACTQTDCDRLVSAEAARCRRAASLAAGRVTRSTGLETSAAPRPSSTACSISGIAALIVARRLRVRRGPSTELFDRHLRQTVCDRQTERCSHAESSARGRLGQCAIRSHASSGDCRTRTVTRPAASGPTATAARAAAAWR